MKLVPRSATTADVNRWHPGVTASFRAWVCEVDGEPEGIIGFALTRPFACMFSAFTETLKPHLRSLTVLRIIKRAEAALGQITLPVLAIAQDDQPTAPQILQRLGFVPVGEFDGAQIYQWNPK